VFLPELGTSDTGIDISIFDTYLVKESIYIEYRVVGQKRGAPHYLPFCTARLLYFPALCPLPALFAYFYCEITFSYCAVYESPTGCLHDRAEIFARFFALYAITRAMQSACLFLLRNLRNFLTPTHSAIISQLPAFCSLLLRDSRNFV
jgi:hypothetical protein